MRRWQTICNDVSNSMNTAMSVLLRNITQKSSGNVRGGDDYVWQYEYYEDDMPVSFEGLRAHRYSIVIGFWVGLAVFVIFMFFVLTLLTKTGAPHQEHPGYSVKSAHVGACVVDMGTKALCRPLLEEFPFQPSVHQRNLDAVITAANHYPDDPFAEGDLLSQFSIPNVVMTSEPDLNATNDDLLLREPPIILEDQSSHATIRTYNSQ